MKRILIRAVAVTMAAATMTTGYASPAWADHECKAEGLEPYADDKTYVLTAYALANCTQEQDALVVRAGAESYSNSAGQWRPEAESAKTFPEAYYGFWMVNTSCAMSHKMWRSKSDVSAVRQWSAIANHVTNARAWSGPKWFDCGEPLPDIDPGHL